MTRVNGPLGFLRFAGSAALAGYRWLRLAWRGLSRPVRGLLVTEAMTSSDARKSWSGGNGAQAADRLADGVQGTDE